MFAPSFLQEACPPMSRPCAAILCVEDDLEAAGLISEALTERGFAVRVAGNGRDALASVFAEPPDLVLCDIGMPAMSGF
jgi:CheY-like chemotaxis protein